MQKFFRLELHLIAEVFSKHWFGLAYSNGVSFQILFVSKVFKFQDQLKSLINSTLIARKN